MSIEKILYDHEYSTGWRSGAICPCGFVPDVDPESLRTQQDYHRAHVADLIRAELASDEAVEAVARTIAEESGDVTRYSTTAVDDHNRWSWIGDGHDVAFRDWFRDIARVALEAATTLGGE